MFKRILLKTCDQVSSSPTWQPLYIEAKLDLLYLKVADQAYT